MLWLLVALTWLAQAKTVLVQGPQTSVIEYKAMLKSHPDLVSPVEQYLAVHPSAMNRERLLALFAEAQHTFLAQSNEEAIPKFEAIAQMIGADDWDRTDREVILQAYMRLAQMENDTSKRDMWLGRSLLLSDAPLASDLYPPPLLARRSEIERQLPQRDISRKLRAQGWNEILVAGRPCAKDSCGPIAPGRVRVTLLSDQLAAYSKVMELADLEKSEIAAETWANGDCAQTALAEGAKTFAAVKVFWGLKCKDEPSLTILAGKRTNAPEPLPVFTTAAPSTKKFYHSPWFWAGAGAVIVAIVVASTPKRESKEPTTTYGN